MPRLTIKFILTVLSLLLLLPPGAFAADQAVLFIYHRFDDPRYPSTDISARDFQAHLELLKREKFSVVTLARVVDSFEGGAPLPERCAVITVDDAYRSFLTVAWPLLKRYGFPATLFVSTDAIGGREFLSWEELRRLRDEGVEIGNHSASHGHLLERLSGEDDPAWERRIGEDIRRAQQALTSNLGTAPTLFAYPYGEYSAALAELVRQLGFQAALGQQSGIASSSSDIYRLPRFPVGGDYAGAAEFRGRLFMRPLPVKDVVADSLYAAQDNPPVLSFSLNLEEIDTSSLRCFVPGQPDCTIRRVPGRAGAYEAVAVRPLVEERSKYTLTASDRSGRNWYWYSHLWVRQKR